MILQIQAFLCTYAPLLPKTCADQRSRRVCFQLSQWQLTKKRHKPLPHPLLQDSESHRHEHEGGQVCHKMRLWFIGGENLTTPEKLGRSEQQRPDGETWERSHHDWEDLPRNQVEEKPRTTTPGEWIYRVTVKLGQGHLGQCTKFDRVLIFSDVEQRARWRNPHVATSMAN